MTPDSPEVRDEGEQEPVVVRDRRRIDPDTGQRRDAAAHGTETGAADQPEAGDEPASGPRRTEEGVESMSGTLDGEFAEDAAQDAAAPAEAEDATADLRAQVADLTADLKRVTAEYANYRKRVERDREGVVEAAKAAVVGDLLMILDDLERAESHGDLVGAFKAVADKLHSTLQTSGLAAFGAEGDEFDPSVHEAVQHMTSPEVSGPTVTAVLRRGYKFGERVLRPAMVAVTDHEPASAEQDQSADDGDASDQA